MNRPIVLVGMMGVGKSSVGKRLANKLGCTFVDADDEIEAAANMSIAGIFERFGEDQFRDGERRVIARLLDGRPKVIATGGGAFINDETRKLILEQAISIWMDADLDILVERVSRRSHRPLLKGKNSEEIRETLAKLGETRNPLYAQADIRVESNSSPHADTVSKIIGALQNG